MTRFLARHHDELVERCRKKVAARAAPLAAGPDRVRGIATFLRQFADGAAGTAGDADPIGAAAREHGRGMQAAGFTIAQVVHDYGDVREAVAEVALERRAALSSKDLRALDTCLAGALADAVTEFASRRDVALAADRTALANERLGSLAHELQNLLYAATIAFEALKGGGVGVRGSTGALVSRSIAGMRDLIDDTMSDVRLTAGIANRESIDVRDFLEEIAFAALLEAKTRRLRLTVAPVAEGVVVRGDRQILRSVVSNLVRNALKFTRPDTEIVVRTRTTSSRVRIDVEDACGGLPDGAAAQMFGAFGPQSGSDRTGLGLGLAIARRGAEALGAKLTVRDLPGKGCVFTVDLARRRGA